jgi:hypothetical protein
LLGPQRPRGDVLGGHGGVRGGVVAPGVDGWSEGFVIEVLGGGRVCMSWWVECWRGWNSAESGGREMEAPSQLFLQLAPIMFCATVAAGISVHVTRES